MTNVTCQLLFLNDVTISTLPSKWRPIRISSNAYSHFAKSREYKIRRPSFFKDLRTIYIDGNVAIRNDPQNMLRMCNSTLCMFSLGRNLESEIRWLQEKGYANESQYIELRRRNRALLKEEAWYGKVIVRKYGTRELSCFEDVWIASIREPGAVQRDQVHINGALRKCGQTIQNLRTNWTDRTRPYKDPNFVHYFQHLGHAKKKQKK